MSLARTIYSSRQIRTSIGRRATVLWTQITRAAWRRAAISATRLPSRSAARRVEIRRTL